MAMTCDSCNAPVLWVLTVGGKWMPLDTIPTAAGNVVPVTIEGERRARVLAAGERPQTPTAYVAHFTTCPAASQHRRGRPSTAAPWVPTCPICRHPMDAELYRTHAPYRAGHPNCLPEPLDTDPTLLDTTIYPLAPALEAVS